MIPPEIMQKIRYLEIKTRKIVNNIFGGEYHSTFKGTGMEFSEVREYYPGDDIRAIDWNVTARTGKPHIKVFDEERELTVMLLIDVSASGFYGTGELLKSDIMIELASVLSFSAIKNNDKVGLLLFSDRIEKYIPPQKGKVHVLRIIREIIFHKADDRDTNINIALEHIQKVLKRKSIIFLLSDFWDNSFHNSMKRISKKHDLVNIHILDQSEIKLPNIGLLKMHDVENNSTAWIDTSSSDIRQTITQNALNQKNYIKKFCKRNNIDIISINTNKGYIRPLVKFFNFRMNRRK